MYWLALLLVWTTKYCASPELILSQDLVNVMENTSLKLSCNAPKNAKLTKWTNLSSPQQISYLSFRKEAMCIPDGFFRDTQYYESSCYSNGTFNVIIKRVNRNNHGDRWHCSVDFEMSNFAYISVYVPIKYVKIKNAFENDVTVKENITTTFTCMTSEGRPATSITWTRLSKKGIKTDLTQTAVYNISELDNGMIISQSSIDLRPLRWDNDTRIICEATNKISNITRREVKIHVQYPPGKSHFQFIAQNEFAKGGVLQDNNKLIVKEGSSFTVICRSDGDPPPTYTWNISINVKSPNLIFTNITKAHKGLYECTAANVIQSFPKYDKKKAASKAILDIDVLYQSRILQFSVTGKEKKWENFEVTENETIHFVCSVDSNPVSSISLSFKEQELWHNVSKGLIYTHRVESCFDAGVYKCLAHNKYNNKPSMEELTLRVRCTPLLIPDFDLKTTITSAENVAVTFKFKAFAYPMPVFKWFKLKLCDFSLEDIDK